MPTTSIIMIDGSFREAFHAVASWGAQSIPLDAFELIWVEYYANTDPQLEEAIKKVPNAKLIKLGNPSESEYHSSYCFNAGIEAAVGDLILLPDGDLMVECDFVARMSALHERNPCLVTYNYRINEPRDQHHGAPTLDHLKDVGLMTHPWNWGGCLGVRKRWLLEVNGFELHPVFATGDHANDFDMYVRLKNLGLEVAWPREPALYHPWHPGTLRFADTHRLQSVVSQHHAHARTSLAFQGIDPERDTTMPADLLDALEQARAEFARNPGDVISPPAARFIE